MSIFACHEGGYLEGDGLAATCGEDNEKGFAGDSRTDSFLLQGFALVGTVTFVTEELMEGGDGIEFLLTIGTSLCTRMIAEQGDDVVDAGIMLEGPGRRDGQAIARMDKSKRVGQVDGMLTNEGGEVGIGTYLSFKKFADAVIIVGEPAEKTFIERDGWGKVEILEEAFELGLVLEQVVIDFLQTVWQLSESFDFVVEKGHGLAAVVDRVVEFVGLELVVLEQAVIGTPGKKQGRKVKGVDGGKRDPALERRTQVDQVMMYDIMTANVMGMLEKLNEVVGVRGMEYESALTDCSDVMYPLIGKAYFCIYEYKFVHE